MLIFVTLLVIYSITKLKISRINLVIYGLISFMNILTISQIFIDGVNLYT